MGSLRDKFLEYKNIDKFLETLNQEFLEDLIKHRDSGALFFGQIINNTVIDYLKNDPKFWWKRCGDDIYITKMPDKIIKEYTWQCRITLGVENRNAKMAAISGDVVNFTTDIERLWGSDFLHGSLRNLWM
ncbi:MAG: hypothetical protein ACM3TR_08095 [Caulobacteraceae bacterium]